jgi:hypothetical protein
MLAKGLGISEEAAQKLMERVQGGDEYAGKQVQEAMMKMGGGRGRGGGGRGGGGGGF